MKSINHFRGLIITKFVGIKTLSHCSLCTYQTCQIQPRCCGLSVYLKLRIISGWNFVLSKTRSTQALLPHRALISYHRALHWTFTVSRNDVASLKIKPPYVWLIAAVSSLAAAIGRTADAELNHISPCCCTFYSLISAPLCSLRFQCCIYVCYVRIKTSYLLT